MIGKAFIFTDHAKSQWDTRFSDLNKGYELSHLIYCTKEETHSLKNSPSFRKVKKDRRSSFYFYKSQNDVYFVTEKKHQVASDTFANVIVTVIDILNEDLSKITSSFKKQMMIAEYNLIEESKKAPKMNKTGQSERKREKDEPDYRFEKNEEWGVLERTIVKANKKPLFSRPIDLDLFMEKKVNAHIASGSISRMNTTMNKAISTEDYLKRLEKSSIVDGYSQDRSALIDQAIILDKSLANEPWSFLDLDMKDLNSFYIKFVENILELKLKVLFSIERKEDSISYEDYLLHLKALSFYRNLVCQSSKIKNTLGEYAEYIINYHSNELKKIEEYDIAIEKSKVDHYRDDFYLLSTILSFKQDKVESIEKISNYKELYELVYDNMVENSLTEINLKNHLG